MCILFSHISRRFRPGEFKLILLNNRDEYFHRAAKSASFVNENNIYGIDMTPGKEGGTWLGLSRLGKIGVLLNLDKHDHGFDELNKAGRGFMVPDYLNSNLSAAKYADLIKNECEKYNPFNLLLYERNKENDLWSVTIFDNHSNNLKKVDHGFVSISNHVYEKPYPKTVTGETFFKNIVNQFNRVELKQELINKLLELGKYDAGKSFEDLILKDEISWREMLREQVYINMPNYGTRTHTIILVDHEDNVTYYERTLKVPIDFSNLAWEDNLHEFSLHKLN